MIPACDINLYGPLYRDGCDNVLQRMGALGSAEKRITWAERGYVEPHIQLPYRYSSCKSEISYGPLSQILVPSTLCFFLICNSQWLVRRRYIS